MQKKKCYKCGQLKLIKLFYKNRSKKDGHDNQCKDCRKKYKEKHYQKNKQRYLNYANKHNELMRKWWYNYKLTLKCEKCGFSHFAALDFHHRNPNDKQIQISTAICRKWGKKRILQEIKKCTVLCANCHRVEHYEIRLSNSKTQESGRH